MKTSAKPVIVVEGKAERKTVAAPPEFVKQLQNAFELVVKSGKHKDILQAFQCAYESRRRLTWLGESGRDGLSYAVKRALALYGLSAVPFGEEKPQKLKRSNLDESFTERFVSAASEAVSDELVLDRFANSLAYCGFKVRSMTTSEVKHEVLTALKTYIKRGHLGISLEPW